MGPRSRRTRETALRERWAAARRGPHGPARTRPATPPATYRAGDRVESAPSAAPSSSISFTSPIPIPAGTSERKQEEAGEGTEARADPACQCSGEVDQPRDEHQGGTRQHDAVREPVCLGIDDREHNEHARGERRRSGRPHQRRSGRAPRRRARRRSPRRADGSSPRRRRRSRVGRERAPGEPVADSDPEPLALAGGKLERRVGAPTERRAPRPRLCAILTTSGSRRGRRRRSRSA